MAHIEKQYNFYVHFKIKYFSKRSKHEAKD